ncbi:uncharacterized protein [Diadema setosum]|uniref:uncharacterized protein n=1 Tax=Diadema setosum TaxID=31175 RepID=UPI003B3B8DF3
MRNTNQNNKGHSFDLGCNTTDPFCPSQCDSCTSGTNRAQCHLPIGDCSFNQSLCYAVNQDDSAVNQDDSAGRCPDVICNKGEENLCYHGDVVHYSGEAWSEDSCTSCLCDGGIALCRVTTCPPLRPGCEAVYAEGKCCPDITCEDSSDGISCLTGGEETSEGSSWYRDPCTLCVCQEGVEHCSQIPCPDLQPTAGCKLMSIPGQCCPIRACRGDDELCLHDGVTIQSETRQNLLLPAQAPLSQLSYRPKYWLESASCSCLSGGLFCTRPACPVVRERCTEGGRESSHTCPRDSCPSEKPGRCPKVPPKESDQCTKHCDQDSDCEGALKCCGDGCTMKCAEPDLSGAVPSSCCVDNYGYQRAEGDVWYHDVCTQCACVGAQVVCKEQECPRPPPNCQQMEPYDDECCAPIVCPQTTERSCNQQTYSISSGSIWYPDTCQTCQCDSGHENCTFYQCLTTPQEGCIYRLVHNRCCPEKLCVPVDSCRLQDEVHLNGEQWYQSPCEVCVCLEGRVSCRTLHCPSATHNRTECSESGRRDGGGGGGGSSTDGGQSACCADLSCQRDVSVDSVGFCLHDSIERVVGDIWFTDPCTSCSCLPSGAVTCVTMSCPPLVVGQACRAAPVQGQCCPQVVCHGVHSCMSSGIEHLNGEVWQEDSCTTCLCHNAQITCTHHVCPVPEPNCRYSSKPPPLGQCCREVVCMPVAAPSCRESPISDKFYLSGEVWIHDVCTIAQCDNGAVITKRDRCPDVSPSHGCFLVAVQGECCPHIDCSRGKPGQCPLQSTHHVQSSGLDTCLHDADCPGSKKCCHDGTSFSCSNPLTIDHQGQCPPILLSKLPLVQACTMSCYSDQDCSPVEKCCMSKGCGMACVRPIILHNARPASNFSSQIGALLQNLVGSYSTGKFKKSGQCPTYGESQYSQRPLVAQCIFDYDCPGNDKCCPVAGFKMCLLPHLEERSGHCPLMRFTGLGCPARQTECLVDQDCPLARKCCFDGCSNQCLPIARAHEDAPCRDISETCGRTCSHGYATNTLQCEICRCSRRCHTQLSKCPLDCPHGYATDRVGCKMCHCKRAVKPTRGIREFLNHPICLPLDHSTCLLNCSRGFATDSLGCVVCRCKPEEHECTPLETCGLYCPLGYATNRKGCDVCRCHQRDGTEGLHCPVSRCPDHCLQESLADHQDCPPCACQPQRNDCPVMTRDTCQLRCQRGFATDGNGCEICKCTKPDDECNTLVSSHTCPKICLHGLATDSNGCRICACKVQTVEPRKDFFLFQSMRGSPCQPITSENCALVCPDGYATDQGCEICACRKLEGCPAMTDQQCPLMASCPYGLATDRGGCAMCECRQPIACIPASLQGCHQHCPHGRATDSDGCEICACKNISSVCAVITPTNCPKLCTYGYATDPITDCEICQCKQPTDIPIPVTSFRICRPVLCDNNCTRGYLYDAQGCQTCTCIPGDIVCPELTIHTCPQMLLCPYGLSKDTRGCPICFCQVESGCYHISRLTCDLQCLYGYATDDRGCDICACRIFDDTKCDPTVALTCPHKCPYGLATDEQGCEICVCKNQARELSILNLRPVVVCPPVSQHCQMDCQHGLATDEMGCSVCRCKRPITDENCTVVLSYECPLVNQCPHGLATDSRGCEVCRCKQGSPCLPLPSCSLNCPKGVATDALGCQVCACKNTSSLCPEVTIEACPLSAFCEQGLATDAMGCEICKCRVRVLPFVPPQEDTYESALPTFQAPYPFLQPSFDATYCPIFHCNVQCPDNDFATNAMGCPVCKCAMKDTALCPPLSPSCNQRHTCPYGLATNEDDCQICACKHPGNMV